MRRLSPLNVLLALMLLFSACTAPPPPDTGEFTEAKWIYNNPFSLGGSEDTYFYDAGNFELYFPIPTTHPFDLAYAETLLAQIRQDMDAIAAKFQITGKPLVYVRGTVSGMYHDGILETAYNDQLIFGRDEMESGAYRTALVSAALGITEPWKARGAAAYIFGWETDTAALREYYSDSDHLDTLSLFGAYFAPGIVDAQTVTIARDTAAALAESMIEKDGAEKFLSAPPFDDSYRQVWLTSLDVQQTYKLLYDLSAFEGAKWYSDYLAPLYFVLQDDKYFTAYSAVDTENEKAHYTGDYSMDPVYMMVFVPALYQSVDTMLNAMEKDAPEHVEAMRETWGKTIAYVFNYTGDNSNASRFLGRRICLRVPYDIFHETAHTLVSPQVDETQIWKAEGIAEYLNARFFPYPGSLEYLTADPAQFEGDMHTFLIKVQDYYKSQKGAMPTGWRDFDYGLLQQAIAVTLFENPELQLDGQTATSIWQIYGKQDADKDVPGNDLTYAQAYLFIKYLTDQYGLDTVLDFCLTKDADYEAIFGASYDSLYVGFLAAYVH